MPQRDLYHNSVKHALIDDGWTITHDPYYIAFSERRGFVDLGAEQTFAAQRAERLIAVEVKSFVGPSPVSDLGEALGQYLLYKSWLARTDPERTLYLAIDTVVAVDVFGEPAAQVLVEDYAIRLLVVDVQQGRISEWRE
jgi:hypothetical protein